MNINITRYESNDKALNFDYDEWVALYNQDPEAFEARRSEWNNRIVKSAPSAYQRRLSGLLFQINMEKKRSNNSMDSCIRLSGLMWEKFHELKIELQVLVREPDTPRLNTLSQNVTDRTEKIDLLQADIIDFERYKKERV